MASRRVSTRRNEWAQPEPFRQDRAPAGQARRQTAGGMTCQQLEAPPVVAAAYGQVVTACVAVIASLSGQLATLEAALSKAFSAHRDAEIVRSQPGLGLVLATRVLAEFGDDPSRYASARGRKAYAGTAPITRASGLRQVVLARAVGNRRLSTACHLWAFAALTGSRVLAATTTSTGPGVPATIRRCGRWRTGWWGSCTAACADARPMTSSWPGRRPLLWPPEAWGGVPGRGVPSPAC